LLVFWPHSVFGQNHLKCKDAVNRDSTIQSLQVRRIQVPYQPSGRPSVHCTIRPDDVSTVQTSKIDQHHPSRRSVHTVQTPYCIEKFLCQLASVWTPLNTRLVSDFFPSSKKGKINQPFGRCGIPSGRASP
jgi:hypothetical protein